MLCDLWKRNTKLLHYDSSARITSYTKSRHFCVFTIISSLLIIMEENHPPSHFNILGDEQTFIYREWGISLFDGQLGEIVQDREKKWMKDDFLISSGGSVNFIDWLDYIYLTMMYGLFIILYGTFFLNCRGFFFIYEYNSLYKSIFFDSAYHWKCLIFVERIKFSDIRLWYRK